MTHYDVTLNGVSNGLTQDDWLMDYADVVEGDSSTENSGLVVNEGAINDLVGDFVDDFFSELAEEFVGSLHFEPLKISDPQYLEPVPAALVEDDEEDDGYTIWPVKTAWTGRMRLHLDDPRFAHLAHALMEFIAEAMKREDTNFTVASFEPVAESTTTDESLYGSLARP